MEIHRRGFIAALFAPFVAKLLPKKVEFVPGSVAARPPILPFKIVTSSRQTPGRIDFINLKDWVRIETRPSDYYDVGTAPVSGDIASSGYFRFVMESQVRVARTQT